MDEMIIIKIVEGSLLSVGAAVLFFLAFKLMYKYLVQEKRCTMETEGIVKRYTIASRGGEGSGVHLPVVSYNAGGKEYKVVGPEYKGYKSKIKATPISRNTVKYYEEKQYLVINRTANTFVGIFANPMQEMYPINSRVKVFYNPKNPKLAYVERYCNKKIWFWLMFGAAVFCLAMDIMILTM